MDKTGFSLDNGPLHPVCKRRINKQDNRRSARNVKDRACRGLSLRGKPSRKKGVDSGVYPSQVGGTPSPRVLCSLPVQMASTHSHQVMMSFSGQPPVGVQSFSVAPVLLIQGRVHLGALRVASHSTPWWSGAETKGLGGQFGFSDSATNPPVTWRC